MRVIILASEDGDISNVGIYNVESFTIEELSRIYLEATGQELEEAADIVPIKAKEAKRKEVSWYVNSEECSYNGMIMFVGVD